MGVEFILSISLNDAIRNVRNWATDLTWHACKNGIAVWSVGNLLIALRRRAEAETQIECLKFRADNDATLTDADKSWVNVLHEFDSAKMIQPKPSIENYLPQSFYARFNIAPVETAEQAAAAYLAHFDLPGAPREITLTQDAATTMSNEPQPEQGKSEHKELQPWEKIPDHAWDKQALKLWWEGFTCPEIGLQVNVTGDRVRNRLSELRKEHGEEIVPTDEKRKRQDTIG